MKPIYLDYNATTPVDPLVVEAMIPYLKEHFGNPSSGHFFGHITRRAVEEARRKVAKMLRCDAEEVIFTSGGSESNNYAIKGVAYAYRHKGNHIITSQIEHPAVLEVCRFLETQGFAVTYLPVDRYGLVDPDDVRKAIGPRTILISVMHANNEVGTIQPIAEISALAHEHGVLMHSDCAQSVGKIPVHVDSLGVDLLSVAGHKLYAPKGIGALYVKNGVKLEKQIHGADHERNLRAGTENVPEIVGLGKACELAEEETETAAGRLEKLRDYFEQAMVEAFPDCKINGHPTLRLPNTSNISFKNIEANTIVSELSDTIAVSAGAACHSDSVDVSYVLKAMNVPLEFAMGTIRFSLGRFTTEEEIDRAIDAVKEVIAKLQPEKEDVPQFAEGEEIKLTRFTHGLGCACKLRPQMLEAVLRKLPVPTGKNILVDAGTADDAAVYKLRDDLAIVQSVDFFTPIVDDPRDFGRIAAANSLSDIYAMGAEPLMALNIVGFPSNRLPMDVLEAILSGAYEVAEQAGISIIGGHTVDDTEPKFGLAVTGIVHPEKILRNKGAKPGDALILTKPIGTGILSTALKRGLLNKEQKDQLINTMVRLNKDAADAMKEFTVHACTDVTGFGLLGHLLEMLKASEVGAILKVNSIAALPGALSLIQEGVVPGGTKNNFSYTYPFVRYENLTASQKFLLNDAQTSGGLLISLPAEQADDYCRIFNSRSGQEARIIGGIVESGEQLVRVQGGEQV
ncbi:MAG: selenide, water dikinase SelD [Calditrichaeota bacterium]|nr:selenide, water dikinase SelD [Calditrichota bacterium]